MTFEKYWEGNLERRVGYFRVKSYVPKTMEELRQYTEKYAGDTRIAFSCGMIDVYEKREETDEEYKKRMARMREIYERLLESQRGEFKGDFIPLD